MVIVTQAKPLGEVLHVGGQHARIPHKLGVGPACRHARHAAAKKTVVDRLLSLQDNP